MAHIREKSSALDGDIEDLSEDMRISEMETLAVSENWMLQYLGKKKHTFRLEKDSMS